MVKRVQDTGGKTGGATSWSWRSLKNVKLQVACGPYSTVDSTTGPNFFSSSRIFAPSPTAMICTLS